MSDRWIPERPAYYVQTGGMNENPFGVPKEEIVRMLVEMTPEVAAQVVFGKYVESSGLVFRSESILQLFDRRYQRILGNGWIDGAAKAVADAWRPRWARYTSPFHTGVDFARQTDWTVIFTIDKTVLPARVVYYKRLNRVPWEDIYTEVGKARYLWGPNILCDSTGMGGDVVMDALESRMFCPVHQRTFLVGSRCTSADGRALECDPSAGLPLSSCEGYDFSGPRKKELVEHLRNCLEVGFNRSEPEREFGWLRCPPIPQLDEELAFYAWDDKNLVTDCVMSLALAAWSGLEDPVDGAAYGSTYGD